MNTLIQVSPHCYYLPHDPDRSKVQPTVGVVCGVNSTILYDAGNGNIRAREVMRALQAINAPPVTTIIYSHFHWDHIFGACAYGDSVQIIAHESAIKGLDSYAKHRWTAEYVRSVIPEKPWYAAIEYAIDDWDAFRIVYPTQTFTGSLFRFTHDGLTLEVEHVGGKHSEDSVILKIVDEQVMFLGDSYYPRADGIDRQFNTPMIDRLKAEFYAVYVDGHRGIVFK